jgi:hypothetical protein
MIVCDQDGGPALQNQVQLAVVRRCPYIILIWKHKLASPFERIRPKREDNIKMNLEEIGYGMWAVYIWLRTGTSLVIKGMNFRIP